jgi:hypothetical protein
MKPPEDNKQPREKEGQMDHIHLLQPTNMENHQPFQKYKHTYSIQKQ